MSFEASSCILYLDLGSGHIVHSVKMICAFFCISVHLCYPSFKKKGKNKQNTPTLKGPKNKYT